MSPLLEVSIYLFPYLFKDSSGKVHIVVGRNVPVKNVPVILQVMMQT